MLKNYKLSKSAVSRVPYTFNDRKSKSINEKVSKLKTAIVQNVCVCILRTQNMGRFGSFFRGDSIFGVCMEESFNVMQFPYRVASKRSQTRYFIISLM